MAITRTGRQLGRRLRRLRGKHSLRQIEATAIIGSTATIRRLEAGESTTLTFPAIGRIAQYYGAEPELCLELEEMYKAAQRDKPWGDSFKDDVLPGFSMFLELECQASVLKIFEPNLITGLLQTKDYSRALYSRRDVSEEQMAAWLELDSHRLERFWEQEPPPRLQVLMGEWALHRKIGEDQIRHLRAVEAEVRLLPTEDGPYPPLRGPFTLLSFESEDEPDCLYTEGLDGSRYEEDPETAALYHRVFDQMFGQARPIEEF